MIVPALTFVGVLALVFGAYWLAVEWPEARARGALRRRIRPMQPAGRLRATLSREVEHLSSVPAIQHLLVGRLALIEPVRRLVEQSGLRITVGAVLLSSGCLALLAYVVMSRWTGLGSVGIVIGIIFGAAPFLVVQRARDRRVNHFEELFPEALDLMTRSMRAGHAFTTGLAMVAEELPQPISTEFKLLYDRQNFGQPLPEALRDFGARIPLLDAKFFVTAVLTQREAGGNLSEVLENLASVIRERFKVRREIRVKSAHGRMTGWILVAMPPCLALAFFVVSPNSMRLLTQDPLGVKMIVGALALQVIGALIVRKIVRIEY